MNPTHHGPLLIGAAVLVAGLAGCNKVGRDEFNDTVADIREQMSAQDDRISTNEADIAGLRSDLDGLRQALDRLRSDFQVRIEELENGIRFATPVHFEFDRAEIRSVDAPVLDRFASVVKRYYPHALVTVEGFADPAGPAAYNEHLSERRAKTVAAYLTGTAGLEAGSIKTVGYGETRQVRAGAHGPGESGIENRRVTFVVEYASATDAPPAATTASR
ncbi:MAG: OmpA family protein [Gemmatimonadota bacterium]